MYLDLLFPRSPLLNRSLVRGLDWDASGEVPAVTGAFLMLRRETIERVGPMDDTVPMYLDDIDWCARSWEAGLPVHYLGSATVVHKRARSSAGLDRARQWIPLTCEAKVVFFRKHRGRGSAAACRAILLWGGVFRLLVALVLWPFRWAFRGLPRVHRTIDPRLHLAQVGWAVGPAAGRRHAAAALTGGTD
jgi:GT2 family glycosyltransferase